MVDIISDVLGEEETKDIEEETQQNNDSDYLDDGNEEQVVKSTLSPEKMIDSVKLSKEEIEQGFVAASNVKVDNILLVQDEKDKLAQELHSQFDSFLITTTKIVPDNSSEKDTIPTGLDVLDAAMGGGFAIGSMSMIVGSPGSGKSMLVAQTMAGGQKKFGSDFLGVYLDSEESTTSTRLWNLGVQRPKIKPKGDITIEKVFKVIEGMCLFKETKKLSETPSIVVWDSIANTASQKEREAEDPKEVIGYKARLLSFLLPTYIAKCASYNVCFITINQLRDKVNLGVTMAPNEMKFLAYGKEIPGGNSLKFNSFQLLDLKVSAVLKPETFGFEGIQVTAKCAKNKLFPPNIPVKLIGNFISGFSNFWTNYMFLKDNNRITQSGGWVYLTMRPEPKFRTRDASKMYRDNDKNFRTIFDEEVKDTIQTELIDKYGKPLDSDFPPIINTAEEGEKT